MKTEKVGTEKYLDYIMGEYWKHNSVREFIGKWIMWKQQREETVMHRVSYRYPQEAGVNVV